MGLARGWKKLYCALVPFSREVGADSTELQLLFIDTQSFTLVDRIWVTGSQSEPFMCRDRLQVEMVSTQCNSCMLLECVNWATSNATAFTCIGQPASHVSASVVYPMWHSTAASSTVLQKHCIYVEALHQC